MTGTVRASDITLPPRDLRRSRVKQRMNQRGPRWKRGAWVWRKQTCCCVSLSLSSVLPLQPGDRGVPAPREGLGLNCGGWRGRLAAGPPQPSLPRPRLPPAQPCVAPTPASPRKAKQHVPANPARPLGSSAGTFTQTPASAAGQAARAPCSDKPAASRCNTLARKGFFQRRLVNLYISKLDLAFNETR